MALFNWVEKAEQQIEEAYEKGEIDIEEYNQNMRELHDELRSMAEEAADNAYNDVMGGY